MRSAQRPRRILVVEDDPATGELVREVLGGEGYAVAVAAGLAEAAGLLAGGPVDLVLADTLLSGAAGLLGDRWAALERVRMGAGGAPVVITTAHHPDLFAGHRERGFAALLPKPVYLDDLLALVSLASGGAR